MKFFKLVALLTVLVATSGCDLSFNKCDKSKASSNKHSTKFACCGCQNDDKPVSEDKVEK